MEDKWLFLECEREMLNNNQLNQFMSMDAESRSNNKVSLHFARIVKFRLICMILAFFFLQKLFEKLMMEWGNENNFNVERCTIDDLY